MFNYFFPQRLSQTVLSFFTGLCLLTQATPGYGKDLRVGFVNIEVAVANTKEWKKEFISFKTKFTREKESISKREEQLKKNIEDLNKKSMVLNLELKKKKEDDVLKKSESLNDMFRIRTKSLLKKKKKLRIKL